MEPCGRSDGRRTQPHQYVNLHSDFHEHIDGDVYQYVHIDGNLNCYVHLDSHTHGHIDNASPDGWLGHSAERGPDDHLRQRRALC